MEKQKYTFSFAGCGFLGIYYVGVTACIRRYGSHLIDKVAGASAGALAALLLLAEVPLDSSLDVLLKVAQAARSKTLGPFSPSFNLGKMLPEVLERILPDDVHHRVNGRLHISVTRVHDRQNVILSQFSSREEVMQAIMCATFIPLFSGFLPPAFCGVRYMDGGFTDNCPHIDDNTITVMPYAGENDICPKDGHLTSPHIIHISNTSFEISKKNINRLSETFFPPNPKLFYEICQQGFDDTLRFFARSDLIGCPACVKEYPSQVKVDEDHNEISSKNYDKIIAEVSCHQCTVEKETALEDTLPEPVAKIFQESIDSANRGFVNKLYSYRGVKLISMMTLPWAVSADFAYATGVKILDTAPIFLPPLPRIINLQQVLYPMLSEQGFPPSSLNVNNTEDVTYVYKYEENESENESLTLDIQPLTNNFDEIVKEYKEYPLDSFKNTTEGDKYQIKLPLDEDEKFQKILQTQSHPDQIVSYYYNQLNFE